MQCGFIAAEDAYAALLISMHTYNLLTEHADRSTIAPDQLPLLDRFLSGQKDFQSALYGKISGDARFTQDEKSRAAILDHFRLLQATDNLSLLTCVDFSQPAHLLHPLPVHQGDHAEVKVRHAEARHFVLEPYPFDEPELQFTFPARHVEGHVFTSADELQSLFAAAPVETLSVTVSAT